MPRPIKWFSLPRLCRAEKPQRGRLREFFQWNVDVIGSDDALADAECIFAAADLLAELGLTPDDAVIRIGSRPLTMAALRKAGVDDADSERYLGIIRKRAETRRTGSEWTLRAAESLGRGLVAPWAQVTEALIERQLANRPVHEWDLPRPLRRTIRERLEQPLGAHMQRDLVTAQETDPVSLAIHLMGWKRIRHLPIEDVDQRLVGLVTRSTLFRFLAEPADRDEPTGLTPLSDVMHRDLVTADADLSVGEAIRLMRERGVSSLPVTEDDRLVGLVTERDFLALATVSLFGSDGDESG